MVPRRILTVLGLCLVIAACSTPLTTREKSALAGGAIGAGALIGAGLGAVSGALIGDAIQANEQRQAPPPSPPAPAPVVVVPPQPQTLYAKEIKANSVAAQVIYVHKLKVK